MSSLAQPTTLSYTPGSTIGNVATLYRHAHELICYRMRNLEMDASHVTLSYVAKLFCQFSQQELASPFVCKELHDILYKNLIVSDHVLMKRLKLSVYHPTAVVPHWYYIRSWQYSVQDFKTVLDDFTLDGTYGSIIESWRVQLEDEGHLENVQIRYAGQTSNPQSRQITDVEVFKKKNGFMANFFRKAKSLGIEARSYNVLIFEAESLTFDEYQTAYYRNESRDLFEQVIINLFGLDSLFNSQPGGINQKLSPAEHHRQEYLALKPRFFTKLNLYMTRYPDTLNPSTDFLTYAGACEKIHPWLMSIVELNRNVATRYDQLSQNRIQEGYLKSIMELATPVGNVFGHHLIAMLADSTPESAFHGARQITDSESSRAAYVLCDMLSRLEAWERNSTTWDPSNVKGLTGVFPFY